MISRRRHRPSVRTRSAFSGITPSPAMPSGYFSGWAISTKPARSVLNTDRDWASGLSPPKQQGQNIQGAYGLEAPLKLGSLDGT